MSSPEHVNTLGKCLTKESRNVKQTEPRIIHRNQGKLPFAGRCITVSDKRLSVVIPAYNEEFQIGATLANLQEYLSEKGFDAEVIVVNDGSKDLTEEIVKRIGIKCVGYERNRGIGYALRFGAKYASNEFIAFIAADTTDFRVIDDIWACLGQGADIAQCSKRDPASSLSGFGQSRWFLSNWYNRILRLMFRIPYLDTDSHYGARRKVLETIGPKCLLTRGGSQAEMIIRAHRADFRIVEIPIRVMHVKSRHTKTKLVLATLLELLRLRLALWTERSK